jgi:hypothetical protein
LKWLDWLQELKPAAGGRKGQTNFKERFKLKLRKKGNDTADEQLH